MFSLDGMNRHSILRLAAAILAGVGSAWAIGAAIILSSAALSLPRALYFDLGGLAQFAGAPLSSCLDCLRETLTERLASSLWFFVWSTLFTCVYYRLFRYRDCPNILPDDGAD